MGKGRKAKPKGNEKPMTKSQKKDEVERKRDERAKRNALRNERKAREFYSPQENDEDYVSFCNQLKATGLKLKEIPGDGNCLFRSLSDQLDGDHTQHAHHRRETVKFMRDHKVDFEPFHDAEVSFEKYLENLEKDGTFAGNDAIVAFARSNQVEVIIHQFNNPRFVVSGHENPKNIQLHIAYHNGEHYSSLRRLEDNTEAPAYISHGNFVKNFQEPSNKNVMKKKKPQKANNLSPNSLATLEDSSSVKMTEDPVLENSLSVTRIQPGTGEDIEPLMHTELSEIEQDVMNSTECKDVDLVRAILADNNADFDATVANLMQLLCLQETAFPAENGECHLAEITMKDSAVSVDNNKETADDKDESIGKKQMKSLTQVKHASNRQRKEFAKQEKKKRRMENQRDKAKIGVPKEPLIDVGQVSI